MKEAPRDNLSCEQAVLHRAGAIQHGAGLIVVDRNTQKSDRLQRQAERFLR